MVGKMNIVIPMMGPTYFDDDKEGWPRLLHEVCGTSLLEFGLKQFSPVKNAKIFNILRRDDCLSHKIDKSIDQIIADCDYTNIICERDTKGSLCSVLMSADVLDHDAPLLIGNIDQHIDYSLDSMVNKFKDEERDFNLLAFDASHPQWSFAQMDDHGRVIRVEEKLPISRHALAGLYFFKSTRDFLHFAKLCILEAPCSKENFFVSDVFNFYIMAGRIGGTQIIKQEQYSKFASASRLKAFSSSWRS